MASWRITSRSSGRIPYYCDSAHGEAARKKMTFQTPSKAVGHGLSSRSAGSVEGAAETKRLAPRKGGGPPAGAELRGCSLVVVVVRAG
jgi:hypothetical protein